MQCRNCKAIGRNTSTPHYTSLASHQSVNTHANALFCYRVDFGNFIYASLSSQNLFNLQSILSSAARIVGPSKFANKFVCIRETLHWLPVPQRNQLNILKFYAQHPGRAGSSDFRNLGLFNSSFTALHSAERGPLVVPVLLPNSETLLMSTPQTVMISAGIIAA